MKNILNIILMCLVLVPCFAQEDDNDNPGLPQQDLKAQQRIKAARAAYITERLGLTPEEAQKFWPIYNEFDQKRQQLRQQLKEARKNGQNDQALLDLNFKVKQQELDLEKDYSGKLQNIITPQKLLHLRQAEGDFRRLLLQQIQQRQQLRERRLQNRDRTQQRLQQRNN